MGIYSSTGCGSYDGVHILLQAKSYQCVTKPYGEFDAGDTLEWTEQLLGSCQTAQFDSTEETISLWIKTNIDDSFCPIWVNLILDDQTSTFYSLPLPNGDWHNYDDKSNVTYTAKKLRKGKICNKETVPSWFLT